jgi:hypothetical protein
MGISRWCVIESKSFELVVEGKSSSLWISKGVGVVFDPFAWVKLVSWLLTTVKGLILEEGMEF